MQRFRVVINDIKKGYSVYDGKTGKMVFWNTSKTQVIARAQLENGFQPVNGLEETYEAQLAAYAIKQRMAELETLPPSLKLRRVLSFI